MDFLGLIGLLGVFCVLAMAFAWGVQAVTGNASWVDAVWSFATGLAGVMAALVPLGGPTTARQWIVAGLVAAWGGRLGWHIAQRSAEGVEDVRYAALRQEWGAAYPWRMFWFLQIQALAAFLLAFAVLLAARNPADGVRALDVIGAVILVAGVLGEAIADRQLRAFRADPANRGRVCDSGLWAWSRHPNYFCEFLVWCAVPLFAIAADWPWGWAALLAPAMMYWLLAHVSGVPPLELAMRKSRGLAYEIYQQRTPAFFPWPPTSLR